MSLNDPKPAKQLILKIIFIILFISFLLGVLVLYRSITIIGPNELGIKELFDKFSSDTLKPGINLVNPLVKVHKISTNTQELNESLVVSSQDGHTLHLNILLQFKLHPNRVIRTYNSFGPEYVRSFMEHQLKTVVQGVAATHVAEDFRGERKELISKEIFNRLEIPLAEKGILLMTLRIQE